MLFGLMLLLGAGVFLEGVSGPQAQRAWQCFLVNFVFWSGMAFGAVLFVAVLNMTNAHWGRPLKRLAESFGAFLPVSFLLFWVLFLGREEVFPWIRNPVEEKAWWLNAGFLFARNGVGLFLLVGASMLLVYQSVRADRDGFASSPTQEGGQLRRWRVQAALSPAVGILYGLVMSLVAFDLIMSLDPHWYSTLFGAYYFIGSFYAGLAGIILLSILCRRAMGLERFIEPRHFHDLGKLLLAFCILTGDFFYAQFLVIWYGNLPEEAKYVILRVRGAPWEPLAWTVLVVCFAVPFVVLLSRKIKMKLGPMMALSLVILGGMWLERLLLVGPSLWRGETLPIGLPEVTITAGFFGLMGLCLLAFLRRVPPLPISDPLFREALSGREGEGSP
jgi:hypothetical protein